MIDGVSTQPFSATTLPPVEIESTYENLEKIIKVSRERYASPRAEVEEKISRWSGFKKTEAKSKVKELLKENSSGEKQAPQAQEKNSQTQNSQEKTEKQNYDESVDEKGRPLYKTNCSACGEKIKVPFKPEAGRPVFCKECLKEYRRQQSKLQENLQENKKTHQKPANNRNNPPEKNRQKTAKNAGDNSLKDLINQAMKEK
jgi:CxxC-x17-CxxC domain-containing protein